MWNCNSFKGNSCGNIKEWLATGKESLPKEQPRDRFRKSKLSLNKFRIIGERGRARKERNREEFTKLSKEYKKKKTDKKIEKKQY